MKGKVKQSTATQGNVKVTVYKNGRKADVIKKHNSGTINLSRYIRDALIGDYVIAKRPNIITPCRDENGELKDLFSAGIPSNAEVVINEPDEKDIKLGASWASMTLTFIIPSTILSSGQQIDGFRLYSNDISRLEYAQLRLSTPISITENTNIEVEWTIKISPSKGE